MARVYKDQKSAFQDFKDQFKSLDGQPFTKKIEHFFRYYWKITAIIIIAIILIVTLISSIIYNSAPKIIQGASYPYSVGDDAPEALKNALAEKLGVDASKYHIEFQALAVDQEDYQQIYSANQTIMAMIMGNNLDFLITEEAWFASLLSTEAEEDMGMYDLRQLIPEETLKRLEEEGRIISVDTEFSGTYPYLINIDGSYLAELMELPTATGNYVGFFANAKHLEADAALVSLIY